MAPDTIIRFLFTGFVKQKDFVLLHAIYEICKVIGTEFDLSLLRCLMTVARRRNSLGCDYSAVHGFWPVEFSHGRLRASHKCRDSIMIGLVFLSASVSTADLVTLRCQATPAPHHFNWPSRPVRQLWKLHLPRTTHCTITLMGGDVGDINT